MWYPPAVAPFAAVPAPDIRPDLDSAVRLGLGSEVYFVGVCPDALPPGWRVASRSHILQLFPASRSTGARAAAYSGEAAGDGEHAGRVLGERDGAAMRELTRLAFPDFFRERTAELGVYLGVHDDERLIAMAGERMAVAGFQEISAVCTHPDHAGKGHARRLTRALMRRHAERGAGSFLHVSEGNAPARRLYASMGFEVRASLAMCKVEQARG